LSVYSLATFFQVSRGACTELNVNNVLFVPSLFKIRIFFCAVTSELENVPPIITSLLFKDLIVNQVFDSYLKDVPEQYIFVQLNKFN
jgi:hypothetical protein